MKAELVSVEWVQGWVQDLTNEDAAEKNHDKKSFPTPWRSKSILQIFNSIENTYDLQVWYGTPRVQLGYS